jgi:protocatechuate 3,4-dioxygenase beta subunit
LSTIRSPPAVGEITYLSGRLFDNRGQPVRGALIEIWQCDQHGAYLHSKTTNRRAARQELSRFRAAFLPIDRRVSFRTIKPVPYPGRTPHIHFKIKAKGKDLLTTQCYVKGHAGNEKDGIYRSIKDEKARDSVTVASGRSLVRGPANFPRNSTSSSDSRGSVKVRRRGAAVMERAFGMRSMFLK